MWGTLVGLLFLNPLAGMAIGGLTGAGVGALTGSLAEYGIDDAFVKKLGETIPLGSSDEEREIDLSRLTGLARSLINEAAQAADGALDFSQLIRASLPTPSSHSRLGSRER